MKNLQLDDNEVIAILLALRIGSLTASEPDNNRMFYLQLKANIEAQMNTQEQVKEKSDANTEPETNHLPADSGVAVSVPANGHRPSGNNRRSKRRARSVR